MPIEMNMILSDDRRTAEIQMPGTLGSLTLNAAEMTEFIYRMAWLRSTMLPEHPHQDLTPETQISNVPAVRWQATEHTEEGQAKLFMLHPGFGWLFIPLHQPSFEAMALKLKAILRAARRKG
jgi:hypothetical protein